MEKKQSIKRKRNRTVILLAFLTALVMSGTGLQGEPQEIHAACTCSDTSCSTCGGDGIYYVCGHRANPCTYTSQSSAAHKCPNNGDNYASMTQKTHSVSCTSPSSYTTSTSGDTRYKNCTKCGARLHTQYYLSILAGTGIKSTSGSGWYDSGTTGIAVSCTAKDGYTFSKWSDGDTRQSWNMASYMDQPKTFTAYADANTYTITYNANGGTGSDIKQSVSYNSTYTTKPASTFTRPGYTLSHWNTNKDGTEATHAVGYTRTYTWAYSYTLYAQWTPNKYKITLDANGGSGGTGAE